MIKTSKHGIFFILLAIGCALQVQAQSPSEKQRIDELEKKVDALTRQTEQNTFGNLFTPVGDQKFGMGPAASKVYSTEQGVSIGGYGEALYEHKEEGNDTADFLRAVLYFGYKYNEKWVFNSEIEFEHASTGEEGSASVEFAYLEYLHSEEINFRAGLLLLPMGFINELHEPTAYLTAKRPESERRIIPSTWRENGVGLLGNLGESISYKAYIVNGLQGEEFSGKQLRGGRQKGSKALAEDLAGVIRIDVTPVEGLLFGGSAYAGDSGQDLNLDVSTEIYEGHLEYSVGGIQLRALATMANIGDVAALNRQIAQRDAEEGELIPDADIDSIGEDLFGWYVELGYNITGDDEGGITPYVRYEELNTQDSTPTGFKNSSKNELDILTLGLSYKPLDEIVFKADYQFISDAADTDSDQINLALGYVF